MNVYNGREFKHIIFNTAYYYLPPWLEHQTFIYRDRISRSEFIL